MTGSTTWSPSTPSPEAGVLCVMHRGCVDQNRVAACSQDPVVWQDLRTGGWSFAASRQHLADTNGDRHPGPGQRPRAERQTGPAGLAAREHRSRSAPAGGRQRPAFRRLVLPGQPGRRGRHLRRAGRLGRGAPVPNAPGRRGARRAPVGCVRAVDPGAGRRAPLAGLVACDGGPFVAFIGGFREGGDPGSSSAYDVSYVTGCGPTRPDRLSGRQPGGRGRLLLGQHGWPASSTRARAGRPPVRAPRVVQHQRTGMEPGGR